MQQHPQPSTAETHKPKSEQKYSCSRNGWNCYGAWKNIYWCTAIVRNELEGEISIRIAFRHLHAYENTHHSSSSTQTHAAHAQTPICNVDNGCRSPNMPNAVLYAAQIFGSVYKLHRICMVGKWAQIHGEQ